MRQNKKITFKKYITMLLFTASVVAIPFMIAAYFLYNNGEYLNVYQVVDEQLGHEQACIWGTAFSEQTYPYKSELINRITPKIVALGSSRVMQFRGNYFTDTFVGAGGVMSTVYDGEIFSQNILSENSPNVVILGIDIWWFNREALGIDRFSAANESFYSRPSLVDLMTVYGWLFNNRIQYSEFVNGLQVKDNCNVGLAGRLDKTGFGSDGSYYSTNILTGKKRSEDIFFSNTIHRINTGSERFEYGVTASNSQVDRLVRLIKMLEDQGVAVFVFFPPFAPSVNNILFEMKDEYAYVEDLKNKLTKDKIKYFDYSDARSIGAIDCEFIDGFHGGEIVYARILKDLYEKNPMLEIYLNIEMIEKNIENYAGLTFVPDAAITSLPEVDFLELGCNKATGSFPNL